MEAYREAGPVYPTEVIDEFAMITLLGIVSEIMKRLSIVLQATYHQIFQIT